MTVVTLRLDLRFALCPTPREKRRLVRGIIDKLRRHFNVSVADVGRDDDPCQTVLVVAAVGRSRRETRETLERVADALAAHPRAEILSQAITEV